MSTDVFVYEGTPGLGTLIGAITATAGTDTYGNPYVGGNASYITIGSEVFAQTSDGSNTVFFLYANGAWTQQAEINVSFTTPPHTSTGLCLACSLITVSTPLALLGPQTLDWPNNGGGIYAEYWHDLRPLLSNSFTAPSGYTPPQVRVTALGDVELLGWVTLPSGSYDGVVFAQLPAATSGIGYIPPTLATVSARIETGTNMTLTGTPYVEIDTSGHLRLRKIPGSLSGVNVNISGTYPVTGYVTS